MSFYELDRPAAPGLLDRVIGYLAAIRRVGKGAMRSLAYARMMRVMAEMDDESLAQIGLTRAQIPAYVERCLAQDTSI